MTTTNPYDKRYVGEKYYWGKTPSAICDRILEFVEPTASFHPKLLDIGCGEGRNSIYLVQKGFEVVALDSSPVGLEKTERYAHEAGVAVKTIHASILDWEIDDTYDVIFSTGTLHYLPPDIRAERMQQYKEATKKNGIHALSVLVKKPFIPPSPDGEPRAALFKSGELMSYYWDWEIAYTVEEVFNCMSSGVLHRHTANRIIARPPSGE